MRYYFWFTKQCFLKFKKNINFLRQKREKRQSPFQRFLFGNAIISLFWFWGCSSTQIQSQDPDLALKDAASEYHNGRYTNALEKLKILRQKFPNSAAATGAQLLMADVYFAQDSFLEAAAAYETFYELHPLHKSSICAFYQIGRSYQKDAPSHPERDQISSEKALLQFEIFIKKFGPNPYTELAKTQIHELRELLALKHWKIAEFYRKRDKFEAASVRYKKILELFPDVSLIPQARERLNEVTRRAEP